MVTPTRGIVSRGSWIVLSLSALCLWIAPPAVHAEVFQRGDVDVDHQLRVTDAIATLYHLFIDGRPVCKVLADTSGDGALGVEDPIATLGFLFLGEQNGIVGTTVDVAVTEGGSGLVDCNGNILRSGFCPNGVQRALDKIQWAIDRHVPGFIPELTSGSTMDLLLRMGVILHGKQLVGMERAGRDYEGQIERPLNAVEIGGSVVSSWFAGAHVVKALDDPDNPEHWIPVTRVLKRYGIDVENDPEAEQQVREAMEAGAIEVSELSLPTHCAAKSKILLEMVLSGSDVSGFAAGGNPTCRPTSDPAAQNDPNRLWDPYAPEFHPFDPGGAAGIGWLDLPTAVLVTSSHVEGEQNGCLSRFRSGDPATWVAQPEDLECLVAGAYATCAFGIKQVPCRQACIVSLLKDIIEYGTAPNDDAARAQRLAKVIETQGRMSAAMRLSDWEHRTGPSFYDSGFHGWVHGYEQQLAQAAAENFYYYVAQVMGALVTIYPPDEYVDTITAAMGELVETSLTIDVNGDVARNLTNHRYWKQSGFTPGTGIGYKVPIDLNVGGAELSGAGNPMVKGAYVWHDRLNHTFGPDTNRGCGYRQRVGNRWVWYQQAPNDWEIFSGTEQLLCNTTDPRGDPYHIDHDPETGLVFFEATPGDVFTPLHRYTDEVEPNTAAYLAVDIYNVADKVATELQQHGAFAADARIIGLDDILPFDVPSPEGGGAVDDWSQVPTPTPRYQREDVLRALREAKYVSSGGVKAVQLLNTLRGVRGMLCERKAEGNLTAEQLATLQDQLSIVRGAAEALEGRMVTVAGGGDQFSGYLSTEQITFASAVAQGAQGLGGDLAGSGCQ